MKVHFEKLTSNGGSFHCFERSDSEFPFYWHYHPEFELTLIVDSHGQRLVADSVADYGPGDLVLLGPNLPHSWRSGPIKSQSQAIHRAVVVLFREDFLGERFFSLSEMEPISRLLKRSMAGLSFGHTKIGESVAINLAKLPSLPGPQKLLTLLSALLDLAGDSNARVLSMNQVQPTCRVEDQQRIDAICKYLNNHYQDEIDFAKIASDLYKARLRSADFLSELPVAQ